MYRKHGLVSMSQKHISSLRWRHTSAMAPPHYWRFLRKIHRWSMTGAFHSQKAGNEKRVYLYVSWRHHDFPHSCSDEELACYCDEFTICEPEFFDPNIWEQYAAIYYERYLPTSPGDLMRDVVARRAYCYMKAHATYYKSHNVSAAAST